MTTNSQNKTHIPSLLQFVFSGLSVIFFLGLGFVFIFSGIISWFSTSDILATSNNTFLISGVFIAVGLCFLPSTFFGLMRILRKEVSISRMNSSWWILFVVIIWAGLVYLGTKIPAESASYTLLFPIIHVLASLLPILCLLWLGSNRLQTGSPQRTTGVFVLGLSLGTFLSMVLEIFLILILVILLVAWLVSNPDLAASISVLRDQLDAANTDPALMQNILEPYVSNPVVIFLSLAIFAVCVPLIEELVKPLGILFFVRRHLSPVDGFFMGMLSGAGFTTLETLFGGVQSSADSWLPIITSRIGTGALHILCSGLVGWGLALAFEKKDFLGLIFRYIIAVSLHGLWNGVVIVNAISQLQPDGSNSWLVTVQSVFPYIIVIFSLLIVAMILYINRIFRNTPSAVVES